MDMMVDFFTESLEGQLHEGQITFYAVSSHEPPEKKLGQI
jgi:hypothetical protein